MKKNIIRLLTLTLLANMSIFTSAIASTSPSDDYRTGWNDGYIAGTKTCDAKLYKCNVVVWDRGRQWKVPGTGSTKAEALAKAKKECSIMLGFTCGDDNIACMEI